jgi:hypothetical protein
MTRQLFLVGAWLAIWSVACNRTVAPYPRLDAITRVDVQVRIGGRDTTIASIADVDSVARTVEFVNSRRGGWEVPWYGVPVPTTTALFYRGREFQGSVGTGPNFLETQRLGDFASRAASGDEIVAFHALLGVGTKVIAVPPKPE